MSFSKEYLERQKSERLGKENFNKTGELMKVVEYNSSSDVVVEFQDEWKRRVRTIWYKFEEGGIRNPHDDERVGLENYNNQGCLMRIIDYKKCTDMTIEFQDKYKTQIKTFWCAFENGGIKNPYHPSVCGVGITGNKYPVWKNGSNVKEYKAWQDMIRRCYDEKVRHKNKSYKDVICCEEWLLYENFYEWLHSQENFEKWYDNDQWHLDKDILVKGNKIYSPNTCCLVPLHINSLFIKGNQIRGDYPIGVSKDSKTNRFYARTIYGKKNHRAKVTSYGYPTPEDAFYLGYKPAKEKYIKQIAQEEYDKGNITKKCYEAMMNYEVEITD
jgi:hypothetical protein